MKLFYLLLSQFWLIYSIFLVFHGENTPGLDPFMAFAIGCLLFILFRIQEIENKLGKVELKKEVVFNPSKIDSAADVTPDGNLAGPSTIKIVNLSTDIIKRNSDAACSETDRSK